MIMKLREHQVGALDKMKTGCILCGGVGSGKSITSLSYYYLQNGGSSKFLDGGEYVKMRRPKDLYIITTARKRDTGEWEKELAPFGMNPDSSISLYKDQHVVVASWNNIKKYSEVTDAFFIFDEQRVVGYGAWTKAFLKITRGNEWILLSATPGDTWTDYIPVFIANGFFKNKTEFNDNHVEFERFCKFPKIKCYHNTGRLIRLRNNILIPMDFERVTVQHHEDVWVEYDILAYKQVMKDRWNILEDKPIETASELCYLLRKIVNCDQSREVAVLEIMEKHPRAIIFYNFDYGLDILKSLIYPEGTEVAEWNGHQHQDIPRGEKWVYLVQYTAGAEGWNCIYTDTIIFYSQNYSYKVMVQSAGRIDRLNTTYKDLYYYHIKSHSGIDHGIARALKNKKKFNETGWLGTSK